MRGGLEVVLGAEWISSFFVTFLFFLSALYIKQHDTVLETQTVVLCTSLPPVGAACCFDEGRKRCVWLFFPGKK